MCCEVLTFYDEILRESVIVLIGCHGPLVICIKEHVSTFNWNAILKEAVWPYIYMYLILLLFIVNIFCVYETPPPSPPPPLPPPPPPV